MVLHRGLDVANIEGTRPLLGSADGILIDSAT